MIDIIEIALDGIKFLVRDGTHDTTMVEEIWVDRYYTTGGFDVPAGANVLDIGGGVGAFAIFAAVHGARIVETYEPHPETFELLAANIEANGLGGIITAHHAAVAVESGPVHLSGFEPMPDGTLNTGLPRISETGIAVDGIGVHDALGSAFWDVVKFDIEGYEYELLAEITDDEFARIGMITMEFHHDDEATTKAKGDELAGMLFGKGFDVVTNWSWGLQGRLQGRHR